MLTLQYIRLHIKKVQRRLRNITPFTFLDMRTLSFASTRFIHRHLYINQYINRVIYMLTNI